MHSFHHRGTVQSALLKKNAGLWRESKPASDFVRRPGPQAGHVRPGKATRCLPAANSSAEERSKRTRSVRRVAGEDLAPRGERPDLRFFEPGSPATSAGRDDAAGLMELR